MKKIMTSIATCALVLAGCSNNELLDGPGVVNQDGAIKFGVNTPITRAAELLTNSGFAKDGRIFNIVGLASKAVDDGGAAGQEYFGKLNSAISLTYSGTTKEWSYGASIFWPTQNLDFFSWYTGETGNSADLGTPTKVDTYDRILSFPTAYAPNTDVSKQIDILVGAGEYEKPAINTTSLINLKHATTQVVFKAELADQSALRVDIAEVAMMNVAKEGTLKLGVTAGVTAESTAKPSIKWTPSTDRASYAIASITGAVLGEGTTEVNLTNDATGTATDQKARAMLLIPQTFTAWDPSNEIDKGTGELATAAAGAYIRVKCKINSATDGSGLWLHGSATEYANLFIPVSSTQNVYGEWTPNRRITYVITFGDSGSGSGGGGWTGDPDKPVLTAIKLDVKVNEWDEQIVVLQSVNLSSAKIVSTASIKEQTDLFDMEVANNPEKKYVAEFKFTDATALTAPVAIDITTTSATKLKSGTVLKYVFAEAATIATTTNTISIPAISGWESSVDGTTFTENTAVSLDGTNGTTLYLRKQ